MNVSLTDATVLLSFSFRGLKFLGWYLLKFFWKGAASHAKLSKTA